MATIYSDMITGVTKRFQYGSQEIRDWYRDKALMATKKDVSPTRIMNRSASRTNTTPEPRIGRMMMFWYDPKHKATLPYYDKFPMIFPIEEYPDRFLGINLHYLPPIHRARLMDALYEYMNNDNYDKTSKLKISYQILKHASKSKYFKPCIKMYLKSHVRSPLVEVDPKEWDYVCFLPLARFVKSSQTKVWEDSINSIR